MDLLASREHLDELLDAARTGLRPLRIVDPVEDGVPIGAVKPREERRADGFFVELLPRSAGTEIVLAASYALQRPSPCAASTARARRPASAGIDEPTALCS
jgi:hypothetical protein